METILQQLIDVVKTTAPALWEIARRQVMVQFWQDALVSLLLLLLVCGYAKYAVWALKQAKEYVPTYKESWWDAYESHSIAVGTLGCVAVILLIIIIANALACIARIINPDYYAIKVILSMIGK